MGIQVSCTNCDTDFDRRPSRVNESGNNFCSKSCLRQYEQRLRAKLTCANCGESFERLESQLRHEEDAYCSKECKLNHYQKQRVATSCLHCGAELEVAPSEYESGEGRFCSYECHGNHRVESRPTKPCANCGADVSRQPADLERPDKVFCSTECHTEHIVKQAELRESEWIQYGPDWKRTRKEVRQRDDSTCQGCGETEDELGYTLHVHHIIPFEQFDSVENANRESNLVSLCASCHSDWEGVPLRPKTV